MKALSLAAVLLALGAVSAQAHHGWAGYSDQEGSVSGAVISADLGSPHGVIKVRTAQGVWDVMLAPPAAIQRSGLTLQAIPAGTQVTARGHKRIDGGSEIKTERLVVGDRTYDLYPARQ
ncbi:DUF6152 family protein [Phenylobacterium sp. J426]|uniref:DUF6152 family protein n=1 Tax=Phenylobacterium sp. J426 TaxID=2898439 RepID=UPI002151D674|nr:DUF6152 family protein [Phenylobacterium sp. J426]MCR5874511.1 DUF6152 family protein [Phenylobacterium sp. J426]